MKVNSDAIYGTTFIKPYKEGRFVFTKKGSAVFAIYLAEEGETRMPATIRIGSFPKTKSTKIRLLGYDKPLSLDKADGAIVVTIPEKPRNNPPAQHAWVFAIEE